MSPTIVSVAVKENFYILSAFVIERHAISDRHAFDFESLKEPTKDEVSFLLRYFKDADGLDRVRLGDLNVKYLRTDAARKMPIVAKRLLTDGKSIFSEIVSFENIVP